MKERKVSLIVFYDKNNRILLQDRRDISKSGEEWGFFGGGIEEGESPNQAVVRETKEELTFELKKYEFIGEIKGLSNPNFYLHCYIFVSELPNMDELEIKEGRGMELFSLDEARKLKVIPADQKSLDLIEMYFKSIM